MTSKWIYAHRGTKRDIDQGLDFYRIGPEVDVTDPDCACPTITDAWRAKQIVNDVNASIAALATKDAEIARLREALARAMQTEQGEYCAVCGYHDIECGGHSDEDYARAALEAKP